MKRTIATITAFLIALTILPALAQSPKELISNSTDIYIKLDPSKINETFASYYEEAVKELITDEIFKTTEDIETVSNYVGDLFSKNPIYIAFSLQGSFAIITEISEEDFNENIITKYIEENSTITEEEDVKFYEGTYIDGAIAYKNNNLLISENVENLKAIFSAEESTNLNSEESFTEIENKFINNGFIEIYAKNLNEMMEMFLGNAEYLKGTPFYATNAIGLSISETTEGYEMQTYIKYDEEKLLEEGLDYENQENVELYKYMPKDNVIYFADTADTQNAMKLIKTYQSFELINEETEKITGVSLEEIIDLFTNEIAILIQNSNELIPTFTLMTKLEANQTAQKIMINSLIEKLWEAIENENTTKEEIKIGESTLTQFSLTYQQEEKENPYAVTINSDLLNFNITIGTTDDNILIISNDKNIKETYKQGLENNKKLKEILSQEANSIEYIDINETNSYINLALNLLEKELPNDFSDLSEIKELINALLEPWGIMQGKVVNTNQYTDATSTFEANIDMLIENYQIDKLEDFFTLKNENLSLITKNLDDFEDVKEKDWYGKDVYYLNAKGIIKGYDDGTYKPQNKINRAEFITMVIKTLEQENYLYSYSWYDENPYSDTDMSAWYFEYAFTAYKNEIMTGDEEGTFRPNDPITRAEAAQVMANIIEKYDLSKNNTEKKELKLNDIKKSDWYYQAIEKVYENNIMTGTSQEEFSPVKSLNRAEAATIIRNLLKKL
jgi:hypothetical protein